MCPICAGVLRPEAPAQGRPQPAAAAAEHGLAAAAHAAAAERRGGAPAAAERRASTAESPVIADTSKKRRRRSSAQLSDDGVPGDAEEHDEDDHEADSRQPARAAAGVGAAEPSRRGRAHYRPRDRADTSAERQPTGPRISLANAAAAARRAVQVSEGQSLSDRGSTFQALLAPCSSIGCTDTTLRAIAARAISATTRSYAWRITETNDEDGSMEIVERYDDGGEHGAGERLLQLLQRADIRNICLVVARWFGANHSGDS